MDLTNASAIVTGGAGGFGSATVRRLVQMGAKALTVRATRSPASENPLCARFREQGSRAWPSAPSDLSRKFRISFPSGWPGLTTHVG